MRWLVMAGFLFVALSYISEAEAVRKLSDNESQLFMEITGPTWGLHTVCIKDANSTECTSAYECDAEPEYFELSSDTRGRTVQVNTSCLDWGVDCRGSTLNMIGESCTYGMQGGGYIRIELINEGFIMEERY